MLYFINDFGDFWRFAKLTLPLTIKSLPDVLSKQIYWRTHFKCQNSSWTKNNIGCSFTACDWSIIRQSCLLIGWNFYHSQYFPPPEAAAKLKLVSPVRMLGLLNHPKRKKRVLYKMMHKRATILEDYQNHTTYYIHEPITNDTTRIKSCTSTMHYVY